MRFSRKAPTRSAKASRDFSGIRADAIILVATPQPKATVLLVGKRGKGFEERVEVDKEFAHEGGESEFGGFAFGDEAVIDGFEEGIFSTGNQGSHVEGAPDFGSAAADGAGTAEGAAVAVARGEAGPGRQLAGGRGEPSSGKAERRQEAVRAPTPWTWVMTETLRWSPGLASHTTRRDPLC